VDGFVGCSAITKLSLPKLKVAEECGFGFCSKLMQLKVPMLKQFEDNVFF
jgi:hypothetical protein